MVKGFKRVCRDSGGDETCGMMAAHAKITYTLTKHTHTHTRMHTHGLWLRVAMWEPFQVS